MVLHQVPAGGRLVDGLSCVILLLIRTCSVSTILRTFDGCVSMTVCTNKGRIEANFCWTLLET